MLDRLWNGWRSDYVSSLGAEEDEFGDQAAASVFTRILESGLSDEEANIVHRGERCFVILNAFPYGTGHLLVLPYREVARLEQLDPGETAELWATVTDAVRAITAAYAPDGVNVGLNLGRAAGGSINEHLHVHVLPRWVGDGNFMAAIANTRTLPEPLDETARKVRDAWPVG